MEDISTSSYKFVAKECKITFDTSTKIQEFTFAMLEVQARFKNCQRQAGAELCQAQVKLG